MKMSGPKERATFSLSCEVKKQLEDSVPKNERSRFVEKAIARLLKEDARKSLGQLLDELSRKPGGGGSSTDYLRRKRMEWDGRPIETLEGRNR